MEYPARRCSLASDSVYSQADTPRPIMRQCTNVGKAAPPVQPKGLLTASRKPETAAEPEALKGRICERLALVFQSLIPAASQPGPDFEQRRRKVFLQFIDILREHAVLAAEAISAFEQIDELEEVLTQILNSQMLFECYHCLWFDDHPRLALHSWLTDHAPIVNLSRARDRTKELLLALSWARGDTTQGTKELSELLCRILAYGDAEAAASILYACGELTSGAAKFLAERLAAVLDLPSFCAAIRDPQCHDRLLGILREAFGNIDVDDPLLSLPAAFFAGNPKERLEAIERVTDDWLEQFVLTAFWQPSCELPEFKGLDGGNDIALQFHRWMADHPSALGGSQKIHKLACAQLLANDMDAFAETLSIYPDLFGIWTAPHLIALASFDHQQISEDKCNRLFFEFARQLPTLKWDHLGAYGMARAQDLQEIYLSQLRPSSRMPGSLLNADTKERIVRELQRSSENFRDYYAEWLPWERSMSQRVDLSQISGEVVFQCCCMALKKATTKASAEGNIRAMLLFGTRLGGLRVQREGRDWDSSRMLVDSLRLWTRRDPHALMEVFKDEAFQEAVVRDAMPRGFQAPIFALWRILGKFVSNAGELPAGPTANFWRLWLCLLGLERELETTTTPDCPGLDCPGQTLRLRLWNSVAGNLRDASTPETIKLSEADLSLNPMPTENYGKQMFLDSGENRELLLKAKAAALLAPVPPPPLRWPPGGKVTRASAGDLRGITETLRFLCATA